MDGAALAAKRKFEAEMSLAWHTAAFSGAAQAGKLKKLDDYLPKAPRKPQSAGEMLAILKGMAGSGTPMNIRRVN